MIELALPEGIPGVLWLPAQPQGKMPLVLIGHGGSQHKRSPAVANVATALVDPHGFAVLAVDGPVHGDRREDGGQDPARTIADFRALWASEQPRIDDVVEHWQQALDACLAQQPNIDPERVGWYGVSMGTAYGIPFCAAEPRVRAALLGMWGTEPLAHGGELQQRARRLSCPVQFIRKRDDERFTAPGQEALFESIGSAQKTLRVYEGGHVDPTGSVLDDAIAFLIEQLSVRP